MDNVELANDLRSIVNKTKLTVICGDFNLCYVDDRDNEVTKMFENEGWLMKQHTSCEDTLTMYTATTIQINMKLLSNCTVLTTWQKTMMLYV